MEKEKKIRFINSMYDEKFRIPDGGSIQLLYPDHTATARCEYIDDYHTRIAGEVYHICQFAEIMEAKNVIYQAEPEMKSKEAAWLIGGKEYLEVHRSDDSWMYSCFNRNYELIDGGQIDLPSYPILKIRDMILEERKMENKRRQEVDYNRLDEKTNQVAEAQLMKLIAPCPHQLSPKMKDDPVSALDRLDQATKLIQKQTPGNGRKTVREECL